MEHALKFSIGSDEAIGILHGCEYKAETGVVIIVGGPQYRVGSHRQFVLLARRLAEAGYPTLRFDYRGIGDSTGDARDFESVADDICAAVDILVAEAGVRKAVLWGLCDAASAAMMYADKDSRISGLVLANPWVHSPETAARVRLKSYYGGRLRNPEFWRKLIGLEIDWRDSIGSVWEYLRQSRRSPERHGGGTPRKHFISRMLDGWGAFAGPTLLILSGDDLVAKEFRQLCAESPPWLVASRRRGVRTVTLPAANHTFACAEWRAEVEDSTLSWLAQHMDSGLA